MAKTQTIRKSVLPAQEPHKYFQRADLAPTSGFALVVDGHFKTQFDSDTAAQKAASELLGNYPILRVEIYNALTKSRTLIKP